MSELRINVDIDRIRSSSKNTGSGSDQMKKRIRHKKAPLDFFLSIFMPKIVQKIILNSKYFRYSTHPNQIFFFKLDPDPNFCNLCSGRLNRLLQEQETSSSQESSPGMEIIKENIFLLVVKISVGIKENIGLW